MKLPTSFLPLLCLSLPPPSTSVDHSKFRTCAETSFCRRHRHRRPRHHFRLDPDSLSFRFSPNNDADAKPEIKQRSLLGKLFGSSGDDNKKDKYFRGPAPVLTGMLINGGETLGVAVHFHEGGVARVRITEDEFVRWTSDEAVLNLDEMKMASSVEYLEGDKLRPYVSSDTTPLSNYRGIKSKDVTVLLQLAPFEITLLVKSQPVMHLNSQQMMYFEKKRDPTTREKQQRKLSTNGNGEDKKPKEKEIVGYWEDGLARYADGTVEERDDDKFKDDAEKQKLMERELADWEASEDEDEEGLWEEKFHSHHDSKPHGPMSVGLDVTFPSRFLYGLPEHASSTPLHSTHGPNSKYHEPYRLYNLDVFEYELDTTMALYGAVPILLSHTPTHTTGLFYFNPSETFVDVERGDEEDSSSTAHFISESGVLDLFLLSGPSPKELFGQYASVTGRTPIPAMFSLGYHQCRWNYRDEKDVYQVHEHFEKYDYPYDVLWLDIEHTDGKRYFTWNKDLFPEPKAMQNKLASQGRKMVTIIDPHIKRDNNYYIHKKATNKNLYIKDKDGKNDYDGWCWPGSSSYLDFTTPRVRDWWAAQFHFDKYQGSTPHLHTWNDMNEPSVFNGPEVSMPKDLLNLDGIEHREWHNLYGMLFHRATMEGLEGRYPSDRVTERGFVLSRSFFAGSQRYGAIWTGDNAAEWSHLAASTPMLLSLNLGGIFFSGADVGGFFKDTSAELMTRWMQTGAYQPFFRGHAHHDTKRKEPWVYGDDVMRRLRKAAMERYALLPYWYTVFREGMVTGVPVMRTMWVEYPTEKSLFEIDDQFFVGGALMVKPVTQAGATSVKVLFPTSDLWYDTRTLLPVDTTTGGDSSVLEKEIAVKLDTIPVYQRGGTMIPRKLRLRRSSQLMKHDPYTLYIALDGTGSSQGEVYIDDEHSLGYQKGDYCLSTINTTSTSDTLTVQSRISAGKVWRHDESIGAVERIVIMGVDRKPKTIKRKDSAEEIEFTSNQESKVLILKLPKVHVTLEWDIDITF